MGLRVPPPATPAAPGLIQARIAPETPEGVATACELAASCASLDLDPTRCVPDGSLFEVSLVGGDVVAASLAIPAERAGLDQGRWYTIFPSSTGSCDDAAVFDFVVPEVAP